MFSLVFWRGFKVSTLCVFVGLLLLTYNVYCNVCTTAPEMQSIKGNLLTYLLTYSRRPTDATDRLSFLPGNKSTTNQTNEVSAHGSTQPCIPPCGR